MIENLNVDDLSEITLNARVPKQPTGWLETNLPKSVMSGLQSYIESAKKNPRDANSTLAGNISKSLFLEDKNNWFFETILISLISKFTECYPTYLRDIRIFKEDLPFCLDKFWVNFQKENEFNPPHNHTGLFSFVIFVKIPTDWREQHALPVSTNSNFPSASNFNFVYTTLLGEMEHYDYYLDKTSEGGMLFFPSKLMHEVFPFYNCDKERISISGNICFDNSTSKL